METATGDKTTGVRHNDGMGQHGDGRHDDGSRATGGPMMAMSGTTTRQIEGDGRHDDAAR